VTAAFLVTRSLMWQRVRLSVRPFIRLSAGEIYADAYCETLAEFMIADFTDINFVDPE